MALDDVVLALQKKNLRRTSEELVNSYYSKLWKGNGMQRLRHYKSAAAPQATEDGVTILTGAQLQLGAMNSASERILGIAR